MSKTIEAFKKFEEIFHLYTAQLKAQIYRDPTDVAKLDAFRAELQEYILISNEIKSIAENFNKELSSKENDYNQKLENIVKPKRLDKELIAIKNEYKSEIDSVEERFLNNISARFTKLSEVQKSIIDKFPELKNIESPKCGTICRTFTDEAFNKDAQEKIDIFNQKIDIRIKDHQDKIKKENEEKKQIQKEKKAKELAAAKAKKEAEEKAREIAEEKARKKAEQSEKLKQQGIILETFIDRKIKELKEEKQQILENVEQFNQKVKEKVSEISKLEESLEKKRIELSTTMTEYNEYREANETLSTAMPSIENGKGKERVRRLEYFKHMLSIESEVAPSTRKRDCLKKLFSKPEQEGSEAGRSNEAYHCLLELNLEQTNSENGLADTEKKLSTLLLEIASIQTKTLPTLYQESKDFHEEKWKYDKYAENRLRKIDQDIENLSVSIRVEGSSARSKFFANASEKLKRNTSACNFSDRKAHSDESRFRPELQALDLTKGSTP